MISRYLGSWWAIAGVWLACGLWLLCGLDYEALTLLLSVIAITATQLVLRDTDTITCRQERKLDAIVEGTDADNSVLEE